MGLTDSIINRAKKEQAKQEKKRQEIPSQPILSQQPQQQMGQIQSMPYFPPQQVQMNEKILKTLCLDDTKAEVQRLGKLSPASIDMIFRVLAFTKAYIEPLQLSVDGKKYELAPDTIKQIVNTFINLSVSEDGFLIKNIVELYRASDIVDMKPKM